VPSTLASVGDIGMRRSAFFWARELMHAKSARPWLQSSARVGRIYRQAQILQRQPSNGLIWLTDRMKHWPTEYVERWWEGSKLVGLV
jgi:hypothetical protein